VTSFRFFLITLTPSLASLIFRALDGLSTDTALLNEIFTLVPHRDLALTADAFNRKFGVNLRDRLQAKLSGTRNHLQLLTKLLQIGRVEDQTVDAERAVEQARALGVILAKKNLLGNLNDDATTELIDFILTLSYSQTQLVKVLSLSLSLSPSLLIADRNNSSCKIQPNPPSKLSSLSALEGDFSKPSISSSLSPPRCMPARSWRPARAAQMRPSGESLEVSESMISAAVFILLSEQGITWPMWTKSRLSIKTTSVLT
jgi:hypothetical protein